MILTSIGFMSYINNIINTIILLNYFICFSGLGRYYYDRE